MMPNTRWVQVWEEDYNLQGELIRGMLEAHGFNVILSSEGYQNALGLDGPPFHRVQILVPDSEAEQARTVLERYHRGELEIDEDAPPQG